MSGSQQVPELCSSPFHQSHSYLCTLYHHGYSTGGSTVQEGFTSLILPQSTASQRAKNGHLQGQINLCTSCRGCCRRFQISAEVLLSLLLGCSHSLCTCSAPALLQTDQLPSAHLEGWPRCLGRGRREVFAFPPLQRAPIRPPADTARSWSCYRLQSPEDGKCHISPEQA